VTTLGSSVVDLFGLTAVDPLASTGQDAPSFSPEVREELERDLFAILPAPAPAKPASEAS
jgi:[protein-PII] uridylyltransferase